MPSCHEINFDALVGPTHNYAGLGLGNLASQKHKLTISNPRAAALEGLAKMKLLMDLGIRQAVLPPQDRPDVEALRKLGFAGSDAQVLQKAGAAEPELLAMCASASAMWAANAATVSPAVDCGDGRLHITPANLISQLHRSLESAGTLATLRAIFSDEARFAVHEPLPAADQMSDEGAANHSRLCVEHGSTGLELFVYGRSASDPTEPRRFPARQTLQASQAVARLHHLDPQKTVFIQQNPAAIDAGVFHCDVIAVANQNVLICHESAFVGGRDAIEAIAGKFRDCLGSELLCHVAAPGEISLADAVGSYVFNSQLVTMPDGIMALIAPGECEQFPAARRFLDRILSAGGPIRAIHYVNVRQSMQNGGGPACLRLRIVLSDAELAATRQSVFLNDALYSKLVDWVKRYYRDHLSAADLADSMLLAEGRTALDELTRILGLGSIYRFQRVPIS